MFTLPASVVSLGFSYVIFGKKSATDNTWHYWDAATGAYVDFATSGASNNTACLNTPILTAGNNTVAVSLPTDQSLASGLVVMFVGPATGISVNQGVPAAPTPGSNASDRFGIFELNYIAATATDNPTLDVDISNIDQISFTFTVTSIPTAPFPLAKVGSPVSTPDLMTRFGNLFPPTSPFSECLGQNPARLIAPQDILQAVKTPVAPSFLAPSGPPTAGGSFTDHSYFYMASETTPFGETAASFPGAFGGFLLNTAGDAQAQGIKIGWQVAGAPVKYKPINPAATGINLYRASIAPLKAGSNVPASPARNDFTLVKSMSISDWNAQPDYCFFDDVSASSGTAPKSSSYGFSALSTWFDAPLFAFFDHYQSLLFSFHQFAQETGNHGTLWMGKVVSVTPKTGEAIPDLSFTDENGTSHPISLTWQWGDGTQTYLALQLVGNAFDENDLSQTNLMPSQSLQTGEYQGAVVYVYFPYFSENTDLTQLTLPLSDTVYQVPKAPSWLANLSWSPSAMVFGCTGVFASSSDPDAIAQSSDFPGLATIALPALENVVVSAFNRGIATGYSFALDAMQYISLYQFGAAATPVASDNNTLPEGTYTYSLSGVLPNGVETALSWSQSITLPTASQVKLSWLPQSSALYGRVNIYRQGSVGNCGLVGTVANTADVPAVCFIDKNSMVQQPISDAPFVFYPGWSKTDGVKSNLYAAFLHQNWNLNPATGISLNGLVYGYPYDDQGSFSTNINYGTALPDMISIDVMPLS
ncbi:hypothetical protein TMES_12610 [Thalassospira mesophila]|uniref:Uncharacterized protein n=2 Tax=Thalassospira mesophila TaxID=1293891 RepID=A0A1Y2L0J0_9PROT|nr:hypothetical protein TMES_12610 [Thalassospira mesophila]